MLECLQNGSVSGQGVRDQDRQAASDGPAYDHFQSIKEPVLRGAENNSKYLVSVCC